MASFWAMRNGNSLRAFGAESDSVLGKLPFNKVVYVEVKQPRNGKHHRLYWTLCQRIADAIGSEAETVSDVLKIRTGHCNNVQTKRGVLQLPKSISFAAMDQTKFSEFFEQCLTVIYGEWGIARPDILEVMKDLLHQEAA